MKEYINRLYRGDFASYFKEVKKDLKIYKKRFIVTVNPETLMMTKKDEDIKNLLMSEKTSLVADGIAVVKASKWVGVSIKERITGIELTEKLLDEANKNGYSIYLFGAKTEIIEKLVVNIKCDYPKIKIAGYSNGYVTDKDKVMEKIIKAKPDICLLALGIPMQEKLIYKYFDKFKKGVFIGVGGSFDVLSGTKKRAPKLFIKLNLEWLYRIICEPERLVRFYKYNVKFLFKVLKDRK